MAVPGNSSTFHQRCLRRILGVTSHDQVTNKEILRRNRSRKLRRNVECSWQVIFFAYQIIDTQRSWCDGSHRVASGNKADPYETWRQTTKKICETLASDEMSRMLPPIRLIGGSLLPYAPCAEGTNDDDGVMNALLC